MAKDKKETSQDSGSEAVATEKKSNKMLIIIISIVLVLIIVIGVVIAMVLLKSDEEPKHQPPPQQIEQPQQQNAQPQRRSSVSEESRKFSQIGVLYPMDTYTVNLKSDTGRRYLKATLSLELEGKELDKELTSKTAVIRDRIIRILSSKTVEEVSSQKGIQKVTEQIMDTLNSMITDGSIKGVYFTEFVIQ